jgi:transglutaminase-like putative cysteine protease/methionine-rich copper-binding protein CopC
MFLAVLIFLSIASLSLNGVSATSETSNTTSSNITTNTINLTATASSFSALSTADNSAPTVTIVDPANNSANVAVNKTIKVTFSEPIKAGTLAIGLKDMNTGAYKYITKTISGNTLTITFTSNLTKATQYFLILGAGCITDLAGNPINAYGTTFTTNGTIDSTAPTVTSVDPANNSVNVPINKTIKITFSEPIKAGTLAIGLKDMNTGAYKYITKTISGNTLTITFTSNLTKATQYFLILGAGCITDLAGNPINAYGTTFTTNGTTFTTTQITTAAASVKSYIETNNKLPNYVTIGSSQVTMAQFLQLLVTSLLQISNGTNTAISIGNVSSPTNSTGDYIYGNINQTEFLKIAQSIKSFIDSNGIAPNYASSSLGKVQYETLIYMFSKVVNYYGTNKVLPNYVSVDSTVANPGSYSIPSDLQQYLQSTNNCQVTNSQIQALAKSITSGKTSAYDKAVAIFNWVRDNIGYSFYYNTKYGAVGVLSSKTANCVDTAHLLIALERAAGIPARYEHVYAKFSSGNWYGHVIAQVWINGKWYNADATSSSNTFGVINNWNTATATYKGTYAELPF